ncbi:MAG: TonB-dependent receptor plug domain-containing protein, partial [Calditrichota bacterium]
SAQDYGSVIGYVFDGNNGNPLAGANVQVGKTVKQSSTDEDGIFILENIIAGEYEITISFLGYREKLLKNIIVYNGLSTRINVPLRPSALPGDSIYVYANTTSVDEASIENKIILSADDIKSSEKFGLSYLLQQVAGVQVESAGGSGGVTYVTIHGSRPKEVLILLDGQRLNDPQTGEVDLNSIPITEIERIEIIRQGRIWSRVFCGYHCLLYQK